MKRLLLFLLLACQLWAEDLYFKQTATGSGDFSSAANAGSAANFSNASNWGAGAGKISPADTVHLIGTFTSRLTVRGSGTSTSARTFIKGDGVLSGSGTGASWTGTTVLVGIDGTGFDNIAVMDCEFAQTSVANSYPAIYWSGCDGWLVEDNYIHSTYQGGISYTGTPTVSTGNIIRHNWFYDIGAIDNGSGGGSNPDVCDLYGNGNLFEYNTIGLSMDRVRPFGTGIVIRNNYYGATDTAVYFNSTQYPSHTDGLQSFQGGPALIQLLYEKNYDTDNADTVYTGGNNGSNAHMLLVQDSAGLSGFTWAIQRFNLIIRAGGSGFNYTNMGHIYTYNETYANICNTLLNNFGAMGSWTVGGLNPGTTDLADLRNTSTVYSSHMADSGGLFPNRPTNFTSGTNHSYNPAGTNGQLPGSASPANISSSITSTPPLFTSANGTTLNDYTLQSGSPLKGAGSSYITAVGAGVTSTSLTVTNAQWLYDGTTGSGWPGTDSDLIKVGSNSYQRIVSINYSTKVVTLTSAISWSNGDAILVKGNEDVGALPFSYAISYTVSLDNSTLSSGANSFTTTINNPDAVRGVEYLVDGIPVGTVYASPYTQSYTSDGSTHTVEARALAMWASAVPTSSSIKTLSPTASSGAGTGGAVTVGGTGKFQ